MILHLPSDAPLALKVAAQAALWTHIGGATIGLVAGPVALFARKGGALHLAAGKVFVAGMLAMSAAGAVTAPFFPDRVTAMMGVLTFYLTATGWAAVRRPAGEAGGFEIGAAAAGVAIVVAMAWLAVVGAASPHGMVDGQEPYQIAVAFGCVAVLATACDLHVVTSGGLKGPARLARHIWRITLALFIAWSSFSAQPRAQIGPLQGQGEVLFGLSLGILVMLAFWMIRTRIPRGRGRPAMAAASPASR